MKYLKIYEQYRNPLNDLNKGLVEFIEDANKNDKLFYIGVLFDMAFYVTNYFRNMPNFPGYKVVYQYINEFMDKYSREFYMIYLISIYDGQVCNGGHIQYFDNGYASEDSFGAFNYHKEIGTHEYMVEMLENSYLLKVSDSAVEALKIMQKFSNEFNNNSDDNCDECNGTGYIEETCSECGGEGYLTEYCDACDGTGYLDDDMEEYCDNCKGEGELVEECGECISGEIQSDCNICNGTGRFNFTNHMDNLGLDNEYYKINDKFMSDVENYTKRIFESLLKTRKVVKKINNI